MPMSGSKQLGREVSVANMVAYRSSKARFCNFGGHMGSKQWCSRRMYSESASKATGAREVRHFSDSYLQRTIRLSKDSNLRDSLINSWGEVRIGLVLEELDRMAGAVAYKHALDNSVEVVALLKQLHGAAEEEATEMDLGEASPMVKMMRSSKLPMAIVTASVDSIILFRPLAIHNDLKISGRVVLVGKSSMEILLQVDSVTKEEGSGEERAERAIEAHFTMVARSTDGSRAVLIPDLLPTTEDERLMQKRAQEARLRRKTSLETSIFSNSPKPEEHQLLHQLFYQNLKETVSSTSSDTKSPSSSGGAPPSNSSSNSSSPSPSPSSSSSKPLSNASKQKSLQPPTSRDLSVGFIKMEHTFRSSMFVMQPQKRNIHNKVFGGYLMRLAFEQAWCSAYVFAGSRPSFVACDDIAFLLPVPLGTLVTFDNTIIYSRPKPNGGATETASEAHEIVVEVKANVLNPAQHSHETTNTFFFFFQAEKCDLQVIPSSYTDSMKWLDGKRRLDAISREGRRSHL